MRRLFYFCRDRYSCVANSSLYRSCHRGAFKVCCLASFEDARPYFRSSASVIFFISAISIQNRTVLPACARSACKGRNVNSWGESFRRNYTSGYLTGGLVSASAAAFTRRTWTAASPPATLLRKLMIPVLSVEFNRPGKSHLSDRGLSVF